MFPMNCTCHFNGPCLIHINNQRPPDHVDPLQNLLRTTHELWQNRLADMIQYNPYRQMLQQQQQQLQQLQILQEVEYLIGGAFQQPPGYYRTPNYPPYPQDMPLPGNDVGNNNQMIGDNGYMEREGNGPRNQIEADNGYEEGDDEEEEEEGDAPPDDMEQDIEEDDQEGDGDEGDDEEEPEDPALIRIDQREPNGRAKYIIINEEVSKLAEIRYSRTIRNPVRNDEIVSILPNFRATFKEYSNEHIKIDISLDYTPLVRAVQFDRLEYLPGNRVVYDRVEKTARTRICELLNLNSLLNHLFFVSIQIKFEKQANQRDNMDPNDLVVFKSIQIE